MCAARDGSTEGGDAALRRCAACYAMHCVPVQIRPISHPGKNRFCIRAQVNVVSLYKFILCKSRGTASSEKPAVGGPGVTSEQGTPSAVLRHNFPAALVHHVV